MPTVANPTRVLRSCANCHVNLTGLAVSCQHPRDRTPGHLCVSCAEDPRVSRRCNTCAVLMSPRTAMVERSGRFYCETDEPVLRSPCGHCGCLQRTDSMLAARVEGRSYTFCDRSCATRWGLRFRGETAYRANFSGGLEAVPWDPAPGFPMPTIRGADVSVGIEVEAMLRRCPAAWAIHEDGSIGPPHNRVHDGFRPLEMVSPILYGQAGMDSAAGALAAMQGHFKVAKNAGIHVHVGVEGLCKDDLIRVFRHWVDWGEDLAAGLVAKNRLVNEYCRSMRHGVSRGAATVLWLEEALARHRGGSLVSTLRGSLAASSRGERYLSLNPRSVEKHGTVEFRLWSCVTTPRTILGWTAFCARFVAAAVRLKSPAKARGSCLDHGVMRAGMRLLRADDQFVGWARSRWEFLRGRDAISPSHMAHPNRDPWGSRPSPAGPRERGEQADEPVEVETGEILDAADFVLSSSGGAALETPAPDDVRPIGDGALTRGGMTSLDGTIEAIVQDMDQQRREREVLEADGFQRALRYGRQYPYPIPMLDERTPLYPDGAPAAEVHEATMGRLISQSGEATLEGALTHEVRYNERNGFTVQVDILPNGQRRIAHVQYRNRDHVGLDMGEPGGSRLRTHAVRIEPPSLPGPRPARPLSGRARDVRRREARRAARLAAEQQPE